MIWRNARDRLECMRVRPLLQRFRDGELAETQRRLVARHLEACRRCGLAADTYSALKARLHDLGQPPDPETVGRLRRFLDELADGDAPGARPAGGG